VGKDVNKVTSLEHETIDELCFRIIGATQGVVEKTYQYNPNLAKTTLFLPALTEILIPLDNISNTKEYDLWV